VCLVLGGLGLWLEKRMPHFARVLQGGSLALAYFVTYAAHFVPAFRVIRSPALALTLLSVVVVLIVGVAQERKSPTLAGMALFFGYYTSVVSGIDTFTLSANAVLALAAIFFLARNRWVPISYGAVLATYLAYALWVWKLSDWGKLDRLIFESGYLTVEDFRLRAAFLSLYWLLFTVGGLLVRRETLETAERNGLLTLNNTTFFLLFSLLMYHAYPDVQWQFQFCFAGALLVASAFGRDRNTLETMLVQGLAVATLGLVSYFEGGRLIGALALESVFLLLLARWMNSRWIPWIARVAFAIAAMRGWNELPWDKPMVWSGFFAAATGYGCAWVEKRARIVGAPFQARPATGVTQTNEDRARRGAHTISLAALYFAIVATVVAMTAAYQHFTTEALPWAWSCGAVVIAVVGAALRTREIVWMSNVPLVWAHGAFCFDRLTDDAWQLDQSLFLIAVTFAFGIVTWARARVRGDEGAAAKVLWPYALLATAVVLVVTSDQPERWQLALYSAEALTLMIAGRLARERTFVLLSLAPVIVGTLIYFGTPREVFRPRTVAAGNVTVALVLLVIGERLLARGTELRRERTFVVVVLTAVAVFALRKLVAGTMLTLSWAICGFVLLALGFALKERRYRVLGLVTLGISLGRAIFYDLGKLETVYRILSFIGLGAILLVLAYLYTKNREKLAKWL